MSVIFLISTVIHGRYYFYVNNLDFLSHTKINKITKKKKQNCQTEKNFFKVKKCFEVKKFKTLGSVLELGIYSAGEMRDGCRLVMLEDNVSDQWHSQNL